LVIKSDFSNHTAQLPLTSCSDFGETLRKESLPKTIIKNLIYKTNQELSRGFIIKKTTEIQKEKKWAMSYEHRR
jgi:hypothetical protein